MEVLGVGAPELLLILVVLLLVVGPQRLPEMAAQLARLLRTARRYSDRISREFGETMQEMEREYEDMHGEWKEVRRGLDESASAVSAELESASKEVRQGLDESASAVSAELESASKEVRQGLDESAGAVGAELESASKEAQRGMDDEASKPASRSA